MTRRGKITLGTLIAAIAVLLWNLASVDLQRRIQEDTYNALAGGLLAAWILIAGILILATPIALAIHLRGRRR